MMIKDDQQLICDRIATAVHCVKAFPQLSPIFVWLPRLAHQFFQRIHCHLWINAYMRQQRIVTNLFVDTRKALDIATYSVIDSPSKHWIVS